MEEFTAEESVYILMGITAGISKITQTLGCGGAVCIEKPVSRSNPSRWFAQAEQRHQVTLLPKPSESSGGTWDIRQSSVEEVGCRGGSAAHHQASLGSAG